MRFWLAPRYWKGANEQLVSFISPMYNSAAATNTAYCQTDKGDRLLVVQYVEILLLLPLLLLRHGWQVEVSGASVSLL